MAEPKQPNEPARLDDHPGDGVSRSTARMEAFADAVFAIAFTLSIVEIPLPEGDQDFLGQLAKRWPSYLAYALAALVIGIYWLQHHFTGAIYRTTGHYFNAATVLFLAAVGFIAFPIRAFAEHINDPVARPAAAIFLTCALAITSLAWLFKWSVGRLSGHVDSRLDWFYVRRLNRTYLLTSAMLVIAAILSFASWQAGLALGGLVTLYYLIPPATPVYHGEAPTTADEA